jgi:SsrA-binding protein
MKLVIENRKANFEYIILDKMLAGIELIGTEVKSLRESKASISEAFCHVINNEIFIKGMHISDYKEIKHTNHDTTRDRKLLLHKREINKLSKSVKEKGLTIIPLSIKLSDSGFFKIEIALVKGKKNHDKRESIKEKDIKRELERNT